MQKASFFIWHYTFSDECVEIERDFFFTRKRVFYTDKIEMTARTTDPLLGHFGRCSLHLIGSGNRTTLIGLPIGVAEAFCEQVNARKTDEPETHEARQVTIPTLDLLKKSLLQTKLRWYLLLVAVLWVAIFLMGSRLITSEEAHDIAAFVFRHLITAGTLVLSLGLPTAIIWLWAFTGGFLVEFLKYYRYTASRRGNILCFEYGLILRRRVYIATDRIALTEFTQTPVMHLCGYGKLRVRAVGYAPVFMRAMPILPFIKASALPDALALLLPEFEQDAHIPVHRSLRYGFCTIKWGVPALCMALSLVWGYAWLIVGAVAALLVVCSVLLEHRCTDLAVRENFIGLSWGGFLHKRAWVRTDRIEQASVSASRRKKRNGFVDLRIRVFGKQGNYAHLHSIDASAAAPFGLGK